MAYRASHRGMKELDLVLGGFADAHLSAMSPEELDQFENILELSDTDLYAWIMGTAEVPSRYDGPFLRRVLDFQIDLSHYAGKRN